MPPASRTGPSEEGRLDDGLRGILPFAPYSMTQLPVSREHDETCAADDLPKRHEARRDRACIPRPEPQSVDYKTDTPHAARAHHGQQSLHFGEGSDIKPGEKTRQCAGM